jgi:hypothetical protein
MTWNLLTITELLYVFSCSIWLALRCKYLYLDSSFLCRLKNLHYTFWVAVDKNNHSISQYISRMFLNHIITINGVFCQVSCKLSYIFSNLSNIANIKASLTKLLLNKFLKYFTDCFESQSRLHSLLIFWQRCLLVKISNRVLQFI